MPAPDEPNAPAPPGRAAGDEAGEGGDGAGVRKKSRRRRAVDAIADIARLPGAWMIATGVTVLGTVAGVDDIADALDRSSYVNADFVMGAGVAVITSGVTSLGQMLRLGQRIEKVETEVRENTQAIRENTNAVNEMRADVKDMRADIGTMKSDIGTMKSDIGTIKDGIGTLVGNTERTAAGVERMAAAFEKMSDAMRRDK